MPMNTWYPGYANEQNNTIFQSNFLIPVSILDYLSIRLHQILLMGFQSSKLNVALWRHIGAQDLDQHWFR